MVLLAALLSVVFSQQILWAAGAWLVHDEKPSNADIIVVLGGDSLGNRILRGAELAREGYAPQVLVSGAVGYWGHHESDLAIEFAVQHGYSKDLFLPLRQSAFSTQDEAYFVLAEARQRGWHRILLVTSPSHTGRAWRIFHNTMPDMDLHATAAFDPKWNRGYWWKIREGRKLWFMETLKAFTMPLGL